MKLRFAILATVGVALTLYLVRYVGWHAVFSAVSALGFLGFGVFSICSLLVFVLLGAAMLQLDRLLLHDVVPHDDAIGAADGNQLVGEVVPARVDDDGANAAADGGP